MNSLSISDWFTNIIIEVSNTQNILKEITIILETLSSHFETLISL